MDKIDLSSYFDYPIFDHSIRDVSSWWTTESIVIISPSTQLVSWLQTMGWYIEVYRLSDPQSIRDWGHFTRGGFSLVSVLQVLVQDFTRSYNDGRKLNDDRFDEIIAVYIALQDKTEDELNDLESTEENFEGLLGAVINNLTSEYTTHETAMDTDLTNWSAIQRTRLDNQFANLLTSEAASMRKRGVYNTTSWSAYVAGNAREKAEALSALEGDIETRLNELEDRLYGQQVDMRMKFIEARHRLMTQLHQQGNVRTEIRNKVVEALAAFAERREDDYPSFLEPINSTLSVAISEHANGWS